MLNLRQTTVATGEFLTTTISTNVPNSIILISGGGGDIPDQVDLGEAISATSTVIAVGTLSELDGPTQIALAERGEVMTGMTRLFVGPLHEIAGKVLVQTCLGEVLLEAHATSPVLNVEVFANDNFEPNNILIVYSISS